jgi:glycosyltransferase involved in cell wall biosynthesis
VGEGSSSRRSGFRALCALMRIVYLSAAAVPSRAANSLHVTKMCEALGLLGHEVTLFAPSRTDGDVYGYYGVKQVFEVRRVWYPQVRYIGHAYALRIALRARAMNVELCIGRHVPSCFFAGALGLPILLDLHGPPRESGRLTHLMFRALIRLPSLKAVTTTTDRLAQYIATSYPALGDKLVVARNGADLYPPPPRAKLAADRGLLNVGYTGHLYAGKGMEVIAELVRTCSFAHFHIVGGKNGDLGLWRDRLQRFRNVTFYGHVAHGMIPGFLAAFDVVLLPNQKVVLSNIGRDIGDWTSPIKLFEYMAAGKAIVASNLPILTEVIRDGETALLCDPEDPEEWRQTLASLHADPVLRDRLGKNAFDEFRAQYSWERRAERLVAAATGADVMAARGPVQ